MYLQKVRYRNKQRNFEKFLFVGFLKVIDEKSRIRSRIRIRYSGEPYHTDTRIWIRTKMSWIRNTGRYRFLLPTSQYFGSDLGTYRTLLGICNLVLPVTSNCTSLILKLFDLHCFALTVLSSSLIFPFA